MTERRPFEGIIGNTKELRALQKLLAMSGFDFNISELSRTIGVSRNSGAEITEKFLQWGIVNRKMRRGNMDFFKLNLESPLVIAMNQFGNAVAMMMFPEIEGVLDEAEQVAEAQGEGTKTSPPSVKSTQNA